MKLYADKHRSERSFNIGDMVFLKVQPYVQASLAPRAHQKLSFHYFGSYKVLEKIGAIAYKLEMPESSSIHPIFHVSLLKATLSTKFPFSVDPLEYVEGLQVPKAVLQRRLHPHRTGVVVQLLIKWFGLDPELATWEDAEAIQQCFPFALARGHARSQGEGVS
ncbi:uncharacterized protein [Miscanthus floridulus]|uniref:uncharacterized protein n=1 Tax=Miscanthus floridulus TaxID=154761 RepID=UPI003459A345